MIPRSEPIARPENRAGDFCLPARGRGAGSLLLEAKKRLQKLSSAKAPAHAQLRAGMRLKVVERMFKKARHEMHVGNDELTRVLFEKILGGSLKKAPGAYVGELNEHARRAAGFAA